MQIKTSRLTITTFSPTMAQSVYENSHDDDIRRFVPDEVYDSVEEALATIEFLMSRYDSAEGPFVYPIITNESGKNIGYVQLCQVDDGKWEIGYHIAKQFTGNGYATEAVNAFLPAMAVKLNLKEVYGICLAENTASVRVLRKCDFVQVFQGLGNYQGKEAEIVKTMWINKMMIETERLLLREYTIDDFDALYEIMSDAETMQHYPAPFDAARTRRWIEWNLENYAQYGFGLWAVVLKETGEFIGDCGITIQNIDGEMLPEIGYHIHKKHWWHGYAKEAARAARDWAFLNTKYNVLYSYMKYTNEGSWRTAMANGMKKVKEYPDPKNTISYAFAITREEWENLKGGK